MIDTVQKLELLKTESKTVRRGTFMVNLIAQVINFAVSIGMGIFLTSYLIDTLGSKHYGLIPLSLSIVSYCSILTVAFNTSLSNALHRPLRIMIDHGQIGFSTPRSLYVVS